MPVCEGRIAPTVACVGFIPAALFRLPAACHILRIMVRSFSMRRSFVFAALAASSLVAIPAAAQRGGGGRGGGRGTPIQQGESCPAGTTEIRPRSCMAPENQAPSIVDYRPHSTLVTPAHL